MDVESAFFVLKWFGIIQTGGPMPTDDPESADEMVQLFSSPDYLPGPENCVHQTELIPNNKACVCVCR